MKYYHPEQLSRYQSVERTWSEIHSDYPDEFEHFSSRPFLKQVLPGLEFALERPRAFELGCGTGPGACFLAEREFFIDAIDLIPDAIDIALKIAAERNLDVHYEVMDVTQIPPTGARNDLIVDSYCLQGIVLDRDRKAVFTAVRARLKPSGYFLISNSMSSATRHHPEDIVVDSASGKVYHGYDERCLFDPTTEVYYKPFSETGDRPDDAPGTTKEVPKSRENGTCRRGGTARRKAWYRSWRARALKSSCKQARMAEMSYANSPSFPLRERTDVRVKIPPTPALSERRLR